MPMMSESREPIIFHSFDDIGYVPRYEPNARGDFVTRETRHRYESLARGTTVTPPTEAQVGSVNWFRQQTGQADGCVMCGGPLPTWMNDRPWGGRMTCSNACRQKAYRLRRRAAVEPAPARTGARAEQTCLSAAAGAAAAGSVDACAAADRDDEQPF